MSQPFHNYDTLIWSDDVSEGKYDASDRSNPNKKFGS